MLVFISMVSVTLCFVNPLSKDNSLSSDSQSHLPSMQQGDQARQPCLNVEALIFMSIEIYEIESLQGTQGSLL
jgi:hypothetical protein